MSKLRRGSSRTRRWRRAVHNKIAGRGREQNAREREFVRGWGTERQREQLRRVRIEVGVLGRTGDVRTAWWRYEKRKTK